MDITYTDLLFMASTLVYLFAYLFFMISDFKNVIYKRWILITICYVVFTYLISDIILWKVIAFNFPIFLLILLYQRKTKNSH